MRFTKVKGETEKPEVVAADWDDGATRLCRVWVDPEGDVCIYVGDAEANNCTWVSAGDVEGFDEAIAVLQKAREVYFPDA